VERLQSIWHWASDTNDRIISIVSAVLALAALTWAWITEKRRKQFQRQSEGFQQELRYLQERRKFRLTWADIHDGAKELADRAKKATFVPHLILTPSIRGAAVGGSVVLGFDRQIPIFVCIQQDLNRQAFVKVPANHALITTTKWITFVPEALKLMRSSDCCRILIVDDFAMSGTTIEMIRNCLSTQFGFEKNNIRSATIVCTNVLKGTPRAPDFYCFEYPDNNFYFPWGKAN
jgi:hypoxanthine phosphoribosyltransferase